MRNWNPLCPPGASACPPFSAYLWGIETIYLLHTLNHEQLVFSLPMRNWNLTAGDPLNRFSCVFSLPMRNWNFSIRSWLSSSVRVFSLPMRNWNSPGCLKGISRTRVLSLPMMNWNRVNDDKQPLRHPFSAYLWGIETRPPFSVWRRPALFSAYLWGIETYVAWLQTPFFL